MWVTHISSTEMHISTRVVGGRDDVEIKSMTDLVLVKMDMPRYVQDVRVVRGMGCGLSEHCCTV